MSSMIVMNIMDRICHFSAFCELLRDEVNPAVHHAIQN